MFSSPLDFNLAAKVIRIGVSTFTTKAIPLMCIMSTFILCSCCSINPTAGSGGLSAGVVWLVVFPLRHAKGGP